MTKCSIVTYSNTKTPRHSHPSPIPVCRFGGYLEIENTSLGCGGGKLAQQGALEETTPLCGAWRGETWRSYVSWFERRG